MASRDPNRDRVYAGAYFKYGASTGVGGGHAVYAVSAEGGARVLTRLPGTDRDPNPIMGGYRYVGMTGTGDVEYDAQSDTLLVANLSDQRVYQIAASDGSILSSRDVVGQFDWAADGRIFGLDIHGDMLYVGAVDSKSSVVTAVPRGYVLRTPLDRSGSFDVVTEFSFDYRRRPTWHSWMDTEFRDPVGQGKLAFSQPMITDFWLDGDDVAVVGIRDRGNDMILTNHVWQTITGDTLLAEVTGGQWVMTLDREFFDDRTLYDEATLGSLAPGHGGGFVTTAMEVDELLDASHPTGLVWFTTSSAESTGVDLVGECECNPEGRFQTLGDVEQLCESPSAATPSPTVDLRTATVETPTPPLGSPGRPPSPTASRAHGTPTANWTVSLYLPISDSGLEDAGPQVLGMTTPQRLAVPRDEHTDFRASRPVFK